VLSIDCKGTTAIVTGGSSGVGFATAALFLRAGASVAICGRDAARLEQARERMLRDVRQANAGAPRAAGADDTADDTAEDTADARLFAHPCDVLEPSSVAAFAQAVAARFGRVDILVNNAGQGRVSTFADTDDAAWTDELRLKFFSLIHPTRAFLPWLEKSDRAAIVNVNSLLALQPEPHMVATSAARAGTQNLMRSMATEFAPKGIRVNAILIGLVESGQWQRRFDAREDRAVSWQAWTGELARKKGIQLGRLGKPDEAARAIFFLATPLSSYTTGSHVDVSGGLSRSI
jgi:NAD(P)-dependent dehydrogenase (short-subunit alcohol dehydrogenase family)